MPALTAKTLNQKRADYDLALWTQYDDLYSGGNKIAQHAQGWLIRNTAESKPWFAERVKRFTYKNTVGSIIDDYASTVLQEPLELRLAKKEGAEKRPEPDDFYTEELWPDPVGAGEGDLNQLAFKLLTKAMVKKEAWVMIAKPDAIPGYEPVNLAQQEASGELRMMLRPVESENVINCHRDQRGLAWVMLQYRFASIDPLREILPSEKPKDTIQWIYYTRTTVQSWTLEIDRDQAEPKDTDVAKIEQKETLHHLATANDGAGAVPLRCFRLNETLWLLDRVSLVVIEEMRKRNALSWYEYLTTFPQLAHTGDETLTPNLEDGDNKNVARGSQHVWEVEKDGSLEWLEPSGASLEHLAKRLEAMERDIYKGVQQMAAAQGPGAAAAVQSGTAKIRDNLAKTILCEMYAALIRSEFKQLAELVSQARSEKYDWEAAGASRFENQAGMEVVSTHAIAQNLRFMDHSPTLVKTLAMKTVRGLLPDISTETHDKIAAEIEEMPVVPIEERELETLPGGDRKPLGKKKPDDKNKPAKPGKGKT
jgi:hypothetical protein